MSFRAASSSLTRVVNRRLSSSASATRGKNPATLIQPVEPASLLQLRHASTSTKTPVLRAPASISTSSKFGTVSITTSPPRGRSKDVKAITWMSPTRGRAPFSTTTRTDQAAHPNRPNTLRDHEMRMEDQATGRFTRNNLEAQSMKYERGAASTHDDSSSAYAGVGAGPGYRDSNHPSRSHRRAHTDVDPASASAPASQADADAAVEARPHFALETESLFHTDCPTELHCSEQQRSRMADRSRPAGMRSDAVGNESAATLARDPVQSQPKRAASGGRSQDSTQHRSNPAPASRVDRTQDYTCVSRTEGGKSVHYLFAPSDADPEVGMTPDGHPDYRGTGLNANTNTNANAGTSVASASSPARPHSAEQRHDRTAAPSVSRTDVHVEDGFPRRAMASDAHPRTVSQAMEASREMPGAKARSGKASMHQQQQRGTTVASSATTAQPRAPRRPSPERTQHFSEPQPDPGAPRAPASASTASGRPLPPPHVGRIDPRPQAALAADLREAHDPSLVQHADMEAHPQRSTVYGHGEEGLSEVNAGMLDMRQHHRAQHPNVNDRAPASAAPSLTQASITDAPPVAHHAAAAPAPPRKDHSRSASSYGDMPDFGEDANVHKQPQAQRKHAKQQQQHHQQPQHQQQAAPAGADSFAATHEIHQDHVSARSEDVSASASEQQQQPKSQRQAASRGKPQQQSKSKPQQQYRPRPQGQPSAPDPAHSLSLRTESLPNTPARGAEYQLLSHKYLSYQARGEPWPEHLNEFTPHLPKGAYHLDAGEYDHATGDHKVRYEVEGDVLDDPGLRVPSDAEIDHLSAREVQDAVDSGMIVIPEDAGSIREHLIKLRSRPRLSEESPGDKFSVMALMKRAEERRAREAKQKRSSSAPPFDKVSARPGLGKGQSASQRDTKNPVNTPSRGFATRDEASVHRYTPRSSPHPPSGKVNVGSGAYTDKQRSSWDSVPRDSAAATFMPKHRASATDTRAASAPSARREDPDWAMKPYISSYEARVQAMREEHERALTGATQPHGPTHAPAASTATGAALHRFPGSYDAAADSKGASPLLRDASRVDPRSTQHEEGWHVKYSPVTASPQQRQEHYQARQREHHTRHRSDAEARRELQDDMTATIEAVTMGDRARAAAGHGPGKDKLVHVSLDSLLIGDPKQEAREQGHVVEAPLTLSEQNNANSAGLGLDFTDYRGDIAQSFREARQAVREMSGGHLRENLEQRGREGELEEERMRGKGGITAGAGDVIDYEAKEDDAVAREGYYYSEADTHAQHTYPAQQQQRQPRWNANVRSSEDPRNVYDASRADADAVLRGDRSRSNTNAYSTSRPAPAAGLETADAMNAIYEDNIPAFVHTAEGKGALYNAEQMEPHRGDRGRGRARDMGMGKGMGMGSLRNVDNGLETADPTNAIYEDNIPAFTHTADGHGPLYNRDQLEPHRPRTRTGTRPRMSLDAAAARDDWAPAPASTQWHPSYQPSAQPQAGPEDYASSSSAAFHQRRQDASGRPLMRHAAESTAAAEARFEQQRQSLARRLEQDQRRGPERQAILGDVDEGSAAARRSDNDSLVSAEDKAKERLDRGTHTHTARRAYGSSTTGPTTASGKRGQSPTPYEAATAARQRGYPRPRARSPAPSESGADALKPWRGHEEEGSEWVNRQRWRDEDKAGRREFDDYSNSYAREVEGLRGAGVDHQVHGDKASDIDLGAGEGREVYRDPVFEAHRLGARQAYDEEAREAVRASARRRKMTELDLHEPGNPIYEDNIPRFEHVEDNDVVGVHSAEQVTARSAVPHSGHSHDLHLVSAHTTARRQAQQQQQHAHTRSNAGAEAATAPQPLSHVPRRAKPLERAPASPGRELSPRGAEKWVQDVLASGHVKHDPVGGNYYGHEYDPREDAVSSDIGGAVETRGGRVAKSEVRRDAGGEAGEERDWGYERERRDREEHRRGKW